MLRRVKDLQSVSRKAVDVTLGPEPYRLEHPVRIAFDARPIELTLGRHGLRLYPDISLETGRPSARKDWILVDPQRFFGSITGFVRLDRGETLQVGRGEEIQDRIFQFQSGVAQRHVALTNDDGCLYMAPLDREAHTTIARVEDASEENRLASRCLKNLRRLRDIYGGPIELLAAEQAQDILEQANECLLGELFRPADSRGRPGGLLELPNEPPLIIVGDLHARIDNLLTVLCKGGVMEALRRGDAYLLLLGDTVHRESDGELTEMDSSLLMLDLLFKLKVRFPNQIYQLRGNHESFDDDVGKGGVPQGQLLQARARDLRGKRYARELARYFDLLPYVAQSEDFIACHGGPPRRKVSRQKLIDIHDHPKLARELTWNRLRTPSRIDGYVKKDAKAFRARLNLGKHTPVIVSHTPQSQSETIWIDAGKIKNHHIVFTAHGDKLAVFARANRSMVPLTFSVEPLLSLANHLD